MRKLIASSLIAFGMLIPASYSLAVAAPKKAPAKSAEKPVEKAKAVCASAEDFKAIVEKEGLEPVVMYKIAGDEGIFIAFVNREKHGILVHLDGKAVCVVGPLEKLGIITPKGGGGEHEEHRNYDPNASI